MSTATRDKGAAPSSGLNCVHAAHDGVVRAESYAHAAQMYVRCLERHVFGRELGSFEREVAELRDIEMEVVRLGKEQGVRAEELRQRIVRASVVLRRARDVCRGTEMAIEGVDWGREEDGA